MIEIKEIEDIEIGKQEGFLMKGKGKLLKLYIVFEDATEDINLILKNQENEEIINIKNDKIEKVIYPRAKISETVEGNSIYDYFLFNSLLFIIISNSKNKIKLLRVYYEK